MESLGSHPEKGGLNNYGLRERGRGGLLCYYNCNKDSRLDQRSKFIRFGVAIISKNSILDLRSLPAKWAQQSWSRLEYSDH